MRRRILSLVVVAALATFSGCSKEKDTTVITPEPVSYVGADACQTCHATIYADFIQSGHKYKLNKVDGATPVYPDFVPPLAGPPEGYTWNDISYVIGGFGWKARFIDNNGYIITGDAVQWNLETEEWAAYHSGEDPGTKPFDCGRCHTTGYVESDTDHQGNLPGMVGTWAEDGITCERCHGPGGQHASYPADIDMQVDHSSELCGECHYRSEDHRILASGGLIRHHEQYDEMLSAGHANQLCVGCHDPHKSAKYDAVNAIIADCVDCHSTTVSHPGTDDCVLCHMPESVKSAVSSGSGIYLKGDIRSHIFAINIDTTETQFYVDGSNTYSNGFNGLNFTCLSSCHSNRDLEWAADHAENIHPQ
ncbi:MAG: hypothetical protein V3W18_04150 [candidate division Zixibacteria bacterium]